MDFCFDRFMANYNRNLANIGIELVAVLQADEEVVVKSDLTMEGEPVLRVYKEGKDKD